MKEETRLTADAASGRSNWSASFFLSSSAASRLLLLPMFYRVTDLGVAPARLREADRSNRRLLPAPAESDC